MAGRLIPPLARPNGTRATMVQSDSTITSTPSITKSPNTRFIRLDVLDYSDETVPSSHLDMLGLRLD